MARLEKMITYFGSPAKVACDGNCAKAWGVSNRPEERLSDVEDDTEYLADHELGEAPTDPGTYEGSHGKPLSTDEFPNKWCVRECERSSISNLNESNLPLELRDFSVRIQNMPHLHS